MKSGRRRFWGSLLFAGSLLVAAPVVAKQVVVRVGGTGNYGPVLPVAAGLKLGLFKKAGVKVEFTNFAGGSASMEGLAAGAVDLINYFPPGLALAKRRGVGATIVSDGTLTPNGWDIMVAKNSKLTSEKQLVGKKIGITSSGSTTDFFALWTAKRAGGHVTRVPVGGSGLVPNLIKGNVDAIVAYPPLSYKLLLSHKGKILVNLGKEMKPNLPDVWIASDKIIKDHPKALRAALVGLYSAIVYMQHHPKWSIQFIQHKTGLKHDVAEAEYKHTINNLSSDGMLKKKWVQTSLDLGKLAGLKNLPPVESLFTTKFVPVKAISP